MNGTSISSFIPVCDFGNIENMGVNSQYFKNPLCNKFRAKILQDQLCYEIDINEYKEQFSAESLKNGLSFLVDNNENRQFSWRNKSQNDHEGKVK